MNGMVLTTNWAPTPAERRRVRARKQERLCAQSDAASDRLVAVIATFAPSVSNEAAEALAPVT